MMWSAIGLALCGIVIVTALRKSKGAAGNYYAHDVYGMTPATHVRYAAVSAAFCAVFIAGFFTRMPVIPVLAVYALIFIFYFSSFARGFSDEQ